MRDVAAESGGVQRGDVLGWIKTSAKFRVWVEEMLGKLEQSSFEKNITVAIHRAGYTKAVGLTGRQTRWVLPDSVEESSSPEEDDDDDDDDDNDL